MDWKLFISTFIAIFIAEVGDKTQLAALSISSQTKSTTTVLLATILGLSVAAVVGVLAGRILGELIPMDKLETFGGIMFIAVGLWFLFGKS